MKRTILFALAGFGYLFVALMLFVPLRMVPVANFNLFIFPLFTSAFLFLFYKASTVQVEGRAYTCAYFAGMLLWQVLGEMASLRVNQGLILQFSDVNIKTVGGYFYVLMGWVVLYILWKSKALKNAVCFCFLIFLGIWTAELYLDNFTANVPLKLMPAIANILGIIGAALSVWIILTARKTKTVTGQLFLGGLLYLALSVVFMAGTLWRKPLAFYLKHEGVVIEHEIKSLQEELAYMDELKKQIGAADEASVSKQFGFGKQ
jgi:hypothetical protein